MKSKSRFIKHFIIALPLVISLIFIGYFKPRYDVDINFANTEGEGVIYADTCGNSNIQLYYLAQVPLNDARKTIRIKRCLYDLKYVSIAFSGIEQTDIESITIRMFGIPIRNYSAAEMMSTGEVSQGIKIHSDGTKLSVTFENPNEYNSLIFQGHKAIPSYVWMIYIAMLLLLSGLLAWLYNLLLLYFKQVDYLISIVSFSASTILLGAFMNNSLPYLTYDCYFLNVVIVLSVGAIIGAFTQLQLGICISNLVTILFYIANYFVIYYRIKPIMPSDLKAVGTLRQVIDGYTLRPSVQMCFSIAAWIFAWIFYCNYCKKESILVSGIEIGIKNIKKRLDMLLIAFITLFLSVHNPVFDSLDSFKWDYRLLADFNCQGMILTFVQNIISSQVEKPDGYSEASIEEYLKENSSVQSGFENKLNDIQPKRIIMIMDEAFADLRQAGLDNSIEVMPFIDSLKENTISGNLYVSVLGGGTCNTEFEAITGNSMAFLPSGTYPYNEYITKPLFSLADYFTDSKYKTTAFHPSKSTNWNRSAVYEKLGFQDFKSASDFTDITFIHGLASDISNFRYLENVDQNTSGNKFFFNVTLQNHAGYELWDDLEEQDGLECIPTDTLKIYLSLVRESDKAVEQLVNTYKYSDTPTMIIFFGDHQPALDSESASFVYSRNTSALNEYKTKFFIWTNYETLSEENMEISANYLPWLIIKQGNFEMPPYIKMLGKVHEKFPVLCAQGVIDSDGNQYSSVNDILEDPLIREYQYVQYANMFDQIDDAWFHVN